MMMRDGHIPCQQDGVFRSNCMDCLDRTNVVQGLFAKVTLEEQLQVRKKLLLYLLFYAPLPNFFKEVERAYWFGPICPCVCASITFCLWSRTVS